MQKINFKVVNKKQNKTLPKRKPAKKLTRKPKRQSRKNIFWKITFISGLTLATLFSVFFILVFLGILGPVPSKKELQRINSPVASEVFSADGKLLGRYYIENRSNVGFDEISPNVINALIATEDARFYEHRGIDEIALLRVLFKSILLRKSSAGGGSTLSQQIAKNLFPRVEYGPLSIPVNKLRESIIAYRLERIYAKEEILALYLNTVPFAENIFGIEVAAERFFSKTPKKLTVSEAAALVGMLKANNYYNPRTHPERAKGRRDVVIDQMAKYEYITVQEAVLFKAQPLEVNYRVISYNQGPAPYFLEMLKPQLLKWCENNIKIDGEPYNLYTDGLKIKTTIDYNLQSYAQQSVREYMKNLQNVFDLHWRNRDIFKENQDIIKSALSNDVKNRGKINSDSGYKALLKTYDEEISTVLFTWDGLKDTTITRLDSLKHYLKLLNVGFLAIDPQQGALKAWVGGIDFRFFKYDHVTALRQTGSVFKPFVYLAALENGVPPDKYFINQFQVYDEYQDWAPRNSHDDYGGYYTMKGALAKSLNTVSVEVLMEAGIENVITLSENLGITADLPNFPSLALGVASISLKETVEAFAGIVNDGKPIKMNYLLEIADADGYILDAFKYEQNNTPVVSPENCRSLINMMEAVVNNGTGRSIRNTYKIEGDFAGKTGTTQNNSDGWFIGITPNLVTGCWVGADDPRVHFRTTNFGQGAYMALPIVGKFFNKTYNDPKFKILKSSRFAQPKTEMLAVLNMPQYKEVLEIEKNTFNFAEFFGRKREEDTKLRENQKTETSSSSETTKPLWSKIKNIFKKKEKR